MISCNHDDLHEFLTTVTVLTLADDLHVGSIGIPPGVRLGPLRTAAAVLESCIQYAFDHDYQITEVYLDDETDVACQKILRDYGLVV